MFNNVKFRMDISSRFCLALAVLTLAMELAASAQTITLCTSAFGGTAIAIDSHRPHQAFVASTTTPVVKHISTVEHGAGSCAFGSLLPDITLGPGVNSLSGLALDSSGNLFVAAGPGNFNITEILEIAPPYTEAPVVFYTGTNLRGLAIHGETLYAADFGAGTVLRFNLAEGPDSVSTLASVPGVFGIFAAGHDDLFVTSNAGFTGIDNGVGSDSVLQITRTRGRGRGRHRTPPVTTVTPIALGLPFPEGIAGDEENLYIAAGAVVFTVAVTGGTPSVYAGNPIIFTHGTTVSSHGGYATDSFNIYKFTLLP